MSDQVDMPNAIDYVVERRLHEARTDDIRLLSQQQTLGGGDIRRQDMPFVSNRMDFSRVGAMVMYPIPKAQSLAVEFAYGIHAGRPERGAGHHIHDRPSVHVQREARAMRKRAHAFLLADRRRDGADARRAPA